MAEILLFHHALGRTSGIVAFAAAIAAAGHIVHTPDLYQGQVFGDLDAGIEFAQSTGFATIIERGVQAAQNLPNNIVYAGFSLGVMAAQKLAQTRAGAAGALFFEACLPPGEFSDHFPADLPVQIHGMDHDPWFAEEDLAAARTLQARSPNVELFLYPGEQHLFADASLPSYRPGAAELLIQRVLIFLERMQPGPRFASRQQAPVSGN